MKVKKIENEFGEEIYIKIVENEIFIHHTDSNDDYIPISQFFMEIIIDKEELIAIFNAIKDLVHGDNKFSYVTKINN